MTKCSISFLLLALPALAAAQPGSVFIEDRTWPEIRDAIAAGKTTAIYYAGSTEQNGPHLALGKHNFVARHVAGRIAEKLGNALVYPVMPFAPTGDAAARTEHMRFPGSVTVSEATFGAVAREVALSAISAGFRNVVLMGDHGGGQEELHALASRLDAQYAPIHVRVYYCDEVYSKANGDFDVWLASHGYPASAHGGLPDTSEMLYLGGSRGWVRKDLVATALGDPAVPEGKPPDPGVKLLNNGITGDGRRANEDLGRRLFEMKVDYAVAQIRRLMGPG